jgi:hypothetical protein
MLHIKTPDVEFFDERTQTFENVKGCTLRLEHSLLSISKWESKWKKPFLSNDEKTYQELIDYIRCMTLNRNVDPKVYACISQKNLDAIYEYIGSSHTATTFKDKLKRGPSGEIITSELIYYWMISCNIPFECEKWNIDRLLTLVRICTIKSEKPKKMSRREIMQRNRALNASRKAKYHTRG